MLITILMYMAVLRYQTTSTIREKRLQEMSFKCTVLAMLFSFGKCAQGFKLKIWSQLPWGQPTSEIKLPP